MRTFDPILRRSGFDLAPMAVRTMDVDGIHELSDLPTDYRGAYLVMLRRGVAVGVVAVPVLDGVARRIDIERACKARLGPAPTPLAPAEIPADPPMVTVAVCTRDRPADLLQCLRSLEELDYPALEVLVVDNAPSTDDSLQLVSSQFPWVRYVREPQPGLNNARNSAVAQARGEIIAFTDDDVIVSRDWVKGLVQAFTDHPEADCVTGLVVPHELETPAQVLFEVNGSFCRGFEQRRYSGPHDGRSRNAHLSPGIFGTGANMAFRRDVFEHIGTFDPALDVGTPTNGGGDLEMYLRILEENRTLIYDPRALIWHRHRRDDAELDRQFHGWGAYYAVLTSAVRRYPHLRLPAVRRGVWWMWRRHIRRMLACVVRPSIIPLRLIWVEFRGGLYGLRSYDRSREEVSRFSGIAEETVSAR